MKRSELNSIRSAIEILHRLVPDDEPRATNPAPRRCPVALFAKRYLAREPASDLTSAELWQFFGEVAATGEVEPLSKSEFLRRLPAVLQAVFDVRKSHAVEREGRHLRGFKGVGIRLDA
jgi:hypothetical protein